MMPKHDVVLLRRAGSKLARGLETSLELSCADQQAARVVTCCCSLYSKEAVQQAAHV
jgi:hypothetical protein